MHIGSVLGSQRARQTVAAILALGLIQVPLISLADAPAPWVQKADQKKKKKKKAVRKAPRRSVQRAKSVTRAPELPPEVVQAPPPVEAPPPPAVVEAPPPPVAPPVPQPPASIPAAAATGGGFNWLFPVLGLVGLGGLVAALGSDSNG